MKTIKAALTVGDANLAIVVSRWNGFITEGLLTGAVDALRNHGATDEQITVIWVPGAFEIPIACAKAARSGNYDGVIALGAVIRGDTPHFEYVAGGVTNGIAQINVETGVPVSFGILTTDTIDQAAKRSGADAGNKGIEAALAAVEMINVLGAL